MSSPEEKFLHARNELLEWRTDLEHARQSFKWPVFTDFNWARDYFDNLSKRAISPALLVIDDTGRKEEISFEKMSEKSTQVANLLQSKGIGKGDRVLLMLGNTVPLWETMLAIIKIGAVIIPATTLLQSEQLKDRLVRGKVKAVVTDSSLAARIDEIADVPVKIAVGPPTNGWITYDDSWQQSTKLNNLTVTKADDPLFLYFTSGTTAKPKLVAHSHISYPVGHLTTMYWLGLQPGDIHLNLSSPGWAKHAWSCFFAPWNAEATIVAYQYERFDSAALLKQLVECQVTSFCAPPTVWRMLVQEKLQDWQMSLREISSAGEPLNPEIIQKVEEAWGLTIRDGFGQTETSAQVGNPPGQPLKFGSMGRPLPGCSVVILGSDGNPAEEGEVCLDLSQGPVGLTQGYMDDEKLNKEAMRGGYYHTGDVANLDDEGYITYVGRMDDVFKSSDYRISPFELESILIEHNSVAEAAVVPSPDPVRLSVPKAYVVLTSGEEPGTEMARSIFTHVYGRVSPYMRVRIIEFASLPKTISGKIRRVELRDSEETRKFPLEKRPNEFFESDFPDLKDLSAK